MFELIQPYLLEIVVAILTGVASFIGVKIKDAYVKYVDTKTKKEIVEATVKYVEQLCKTSGLCSTDKKEAAKTKSLEWLNEKGIKISDTELEILIEAAVNGFNNGIKEASK